MVPPPAPFKHEPLPNSREQIRLLRMIESVPDEHLRCELLTCDLGDLPVFHAISYTWGDGHAVRALEVNGSQFAVSQNCWDVLCRASLHSRSVPIWLDQICIDQTNAVEKSHQVALMGSIYRSATTVVICVGSADHESDVLFHAIREHAAALKQKLIELGQHDRLQTTFWDDVYLLPGSQDMFRAMSVNDLEAMVIRMRRFSERPYFSRLWIVQEFMLASHATFVCGDQSVDVKSFLNFYGVLECSARKYSYFHTDYVSSLHMMQLLHSTIEMENTSLFELISHFESSKCADVRDRVYGLLALTNPADGVPITPDYTKDVWALTLDLCAYLADFTSKIESQGEGELVHYFHKSMITHLRDTLNTLGMSRDHSEVKLLIIERQALSTLSSTSYQQRHPIDPSGAKICVVATGHCRVTFTDQGLPVAPIVSDGPDDEPDFFEREARDSFMFAANRTQSASQLVMRDGSVMALLPGNVHDGDRIVTISGKRIVGQTAALVIRATTTTATTNTTPITYEIVGQALLLPNSYICGSLSEECSCLLPPSSHAADGEQIIIKFNIADFLAFCCQDMDYCDNGIAIAYKLNLDAYAARIQTAIVKPGDKARSFAVVRHLGP